jgi:Reverse transcriptase (RNA-dependent DNA polymerase)
MADVPLHEDALIEFEDPLIEIPDRAISQAEELVSTRDTPEYNFRARNVYGNELADKATRDELITCIEKDVWECLDPSYIARGAIPSRMFLTPKTLPNGELDRVKGRIVPGGHRQDRTLYEDKEISSPTVALTSVLTMAALAAHERRNVMTLDHKAAYLNAKMLGPPVVMMLPAEVAEMLCIIDPKHTKFLRPDKKIAVKLKKALYGCVESAVLWYNELTSTLEELGFIRNPYDTCSFSRPHQDSYDRILVYVDDLFLSSASEDRLKFVAEVLRNKYDAVTFKTGTQHDFLGIHWDFSTPGQVSLSMEGYINDIISKYNVTKECSTPAIDRLFHTTADSPLLTSDKKDNFRSCVMTVYYIAKRTLPVLLMSISFCATKVLAPTEEDQTKLERILSFILYSRRQKMILRIGDKCALRAYVDASFGLYEDGKSVTGVAIMLGEATMYVKSGEQKIVTRSSTESELVGISDALSQVLWTREYLISAGLDIGPAIIYQDNQSTMFLGNKGRSTSERSRHIKIRYFFVSHYINAKEIVLQYLPTADIISDILTKPLHGSLFIKLANKLTGVTKDYTSYNQS